MKLFIIPVLFLLAACVPPVGITCMAVGGCSPGGGPALVAPGGW